MGRPCPVAEPSVPPEDGSRRPPPLPLLEGSLFPDLALIDLGLTHLQAFGANLSLEGSGPEELLGMRQRERPLARRSYGGISYPCTGSREPHYGWPFWAGEGSGKGATGLLLTVTCPGKTTSKRLKIQLQPQAPCCLGGSPLPHPPLPHPPPGPQGTPSCTCPELGQSFPDPRRANTVGRL